MLIIFCMFVFVLWYLEFISFNFFKKNVKFLDSESVSENTENSIEIDEDFEQFPKIGDITSDKLLILKSLIKLRSFEISNIIEHLNRFQMNAGEGNWIQIFIENAALGELDDIFDDNYEKLKKKARAEAKTIFENRYQFCSIAPDELYEDELADVRVSLSFWSGSHQITFRRLQEIESFGFFEVWLSLLIKEYRKIEENSSWGNSFSIFKFPENSKALKSSLEKISSIWTQISRVLKTAILIRRVEGTIDKMLEKEEDILIKEIDAFETFDRLMGYFLMQENSKERGISPFHKEEKLFLMEQIKSNPFSKI